MANVTHLNNAPIVEGILDLQVSLPPEVQLSHFAQIQKMTGDRFPVKKERVQWQETINFQAGSEPQRISSKNPDGYLFVTGDGLEVLQARLDGFSFSRLKPYTNWEDFRDKAKGLWSIYKELAKPTAIKRIAVRYINRIEIPLPVNDVKEYFLTVPDVADGIPAAVQEYFMRFVIPFEDGSIKAILTQASEPIKQTGSKGIFPVIFDIDVFRENCSVTDEKSLWDCLEDLANKKNTLFFKSITDKVVEIYK